MKKIISFVAASLSLASGSFAAPFMAIGDGAELFITGKAGVRSDDNIYLSATETDDIIFDINPGLELTFGKGSQLTGVLTLVDSFAVYNDNSNLNTQLFNGGFRSLFDDGKMKLGFNVAYAELNQNAADIRGLTRRDVFSTSGNAEVEVSPIASIGGGISFDHENYKRVGYIDNNTLAVPLDFFYRPPGMPKVDLSFGYRYRSYEVDVGPDSKDHYLNVGARGNFTPKLTGRFTIGWNQRKLQPGGTKNGLGLDASFSYEVSPKTSLQLGASSDYGTSPQGQQQRNSTINATLITKLDEQWSVNGGLSYRAINYGSRTDDFFEGSLGATYILDSNVNLVGAYVYRSYKSDLAGSEFTNNVFSIAANFRY